MIEKNITFARVDSTKEKKLIKLLNIHKFPTLYLFTNFGENKIKYNTFFEKEHIKNWMEKTFLDPRNSSREIDTLEQFQNRVQTNQLCALFLGTDLYTLEFAAYMNMTQTLKNAVFIHTFNITLKQLLMKNPHTQQLSFFNLENEIQKQPIENIFEGDLTEQKQLSQFIEIHSFQGVLNMDVSMLRK
jgi:hypothetical protein